VLPTHGDLSTISLVPSNRKSQHTFVIYLRDGGTVLQFCVFNTFAMVRLTFSLAFIPTFGCTHSSPGTRVQDTHSVKFTTDDATRS
jgi:hypothetical protein